ncbi:MAG TPA: hypothetical protein PLQ44_01385 [Candidatus Paceibacterota bacterium]|nr:hypothetical protein [Candidatus Paceibacterota bacterium]HPT40240.1 hypothetical protein [Candidatus Paceibacterota bacterium]
MDLSKIYISIHAYNRFVERWKEFSQDPLPQNWMNTLLAFLSNVTEIKKKPGISFEIFRKYKKISRFFLKTNNWIFVTDEDLSTLITVEWRQVNPHVWVLPKKVQKILKNKKRTRY